MTFAEKLTQLEQSKGYTKRRQALADAVGVSKSTLGRWFSGDAIPDIAQALRLARHMGVSVDYLCDDTLEVDPMDSLLPETERELLAAYRESDKPLRRVLAFLAPGREFHPPGEQP